MVRKEGKVSFPLVAFLFLLFSAELFAAQDPFAHWAKKSYAERQNFLITEFYDNHDLRKDSIDYFKRVERIEKVAKEYNDKELIYESKFLRLNYLSSRKYPTYISEINELIRIADKEKILQLQIRTRQALGFYYYYELKDYGKAIFQFLKSYEYLKKIKEKDFPEKQEALTNIANICYNLGYGTKAIKFLEEAENLNYPYASGLKYNIQNTKALIYENLGQPNKALNIQKEIFNQTKGSYHQEWSIISNNNVARLLFNQNRLNEAIQYLNQIETIDSLKYPCHLQKRLLLYPKIHLAANDFEQFNKEIESLLSQYNSTTICTEEKIDYLTLLYTYYKYKNDYHNTLIVADLLLTLIKEQNKSEQSNLVKIAIEQNNFEVLQDKELELNQSKKINIYLNIFYVLICILIVHMFFRFYNQKKKSHQYSLLEKQSKLEQKELEIQQANQYLQKFKEDIFEKNKLIEEMSEKLLTNNVTLNNSDEMGLNKLVILTEEDWIRFKKEFSIIHPNFFPSLQNRAPHITPALERLAALLYLDFNYNQIANTLGISKESVSRTNRRLKMMLEIPKEQSFVMWYESVLPTLSPQEV